ncbi:hypothetical protein BKA69DRAFT_1127647 [Paraphysoderma sedebokerense]|nr:hypothetical protein BKA69DRAFT_1127647 [Paraphysoderma sedebokerense]
MSISFKSVFFVALFALSTCFPLPQVDFGNLFPGGFPAMPSGNSGGGVNAIAGPGESVTVINDGGNTKTYRGGSGQGIPGFPQGGFPQFPQGNFPKFPEGGFPGFSGFSTSEAEGASQGNTANAVSNAGPGESVTTISTNINGKQSTRTTTQQI